MSRENYEIEKGLNISPENGDIANGISILFGTNAPGGDAQENDAPLGSQFNRKNGLLYMKETAGSGTDKWVLQANFDDITAIKFRSEKIEFLTDDVISIGSVDVTAFSDNDDGTAANAGMVGSFLIGDADGTPALFEITAFTSGTDITVAAADPAISDFDNFIVQRYLPDTAGQENQALVQKTATIVIKLSDIDWNFATGINLSSGYAQVNGTISSADTVESSIQKLDGNQIDLITLSGEAQGSTDHGVFTGDTISDNRTTHQALQDLEIALEAITGDIRTQATGITSAITLDSILVDDVLAIEWEVHAFEEASPTNILVQKIFATHDGTASGDAVNRNENVFAKLKIGSNFDAVFVIDLDGAGVSQTLRLRVSSSSAGATFTARRTTITAP